MMELDQTEKRQIRFALEWLLDAMIARNALEFGGEITYRDKTFKVNIEEVKK